MRIFLTLTTLGGLTRVFRAILSLVRVGVWGGAALPSPPPRAVVWAVTRRHRRVSGLVRAHRNCVRIVQPFSNATLRSASFIFPRKSRFTGFRRLGTGVFRVSPTTKFAAEKIDVCFSRCGFTKCFFVENGAIFLFFWPLVHPLGALRTENTCGSFQAKNICTRKKSGKNVKNFIFQGFRGFID